MAPCMQHGKRSWEGKDNSKFIIDPVVIAWGEVGGWGGGGREGEMERSEER